MDTLTTLFQHNHWANLRILEICADLTDEQLDASLEGTYGSIRETLQHIVTAERSYLSRISTGQPYRGPKEAQPLSIANMTEIAMTTGSGLIEWAPKVKASNLVTVDWEGTPRDVPKTSLLTQAVKHATEHRSQVMAILTQLGIQPPDLDAWTYFDKQE